MDNSKDAEVRARVTATMFAKLSAIATERGEKMPVLVRAAIAEYISARISDGPSGQRRHILDILRDKPHIAQALVELCESVNYPPASAVTAAAEGARQIVKEGSVIEPPKTRKGKRGPKSDHGSSL